MSKFSNNARRFLLFREGSSIEWDCSTLDLSLATAIPVKAINSICNSNRWRDRGWFPKQSYTEAQQRSASQNRDLHSLISISDISC